MDTSELMRVLARYPDLQAGLPDHVDDLTRIAKRIVEMEKRPTRAPVLPPDAPAWERAYWRRRALATCCCGRPIVRGAGNTSTKCGVCAAANLRYEDGA